MQDNYVGDIGDYGKYGLLREICEANLSLAVNWYKVTPTKTGAQEDGKYISYLSTPQFYREYDPCLFDSLNHIVNIEKCRKIARVEQSNFLCATFFSEDIDVNRAQWHQHALKDTSEADVVFLDPDNGLETEKMWQNNTATSKHVKWSELKDYYDRGQSVVLYQHRPQMTKKDQCIQNIMNFQRNFLLADKVMLLEFPKYTNRFYFMFLHTKHCHSFEEVSSNMDQKWGKNNFCRKIDL